ncbi:DUF6415 family natural product biosynthesis protein [Streptomyces formicae]|uniref:Uncharacterized protein n=1 Tax=Streptomyces formicae TaxID=1616117 RepID=A0ABY3WQS4_9ACTN|nr:DUF6415 family natural product biosynthesis protein [Streptomyces formicae]UNM14998.1 hypothetical protein J4032_29185 [Streptomyces formicae]
MTMTLPRPAPDTCSPPFDAYEIADILSRLKRWKPLDVDALLDDVAGALDDIPPAALEMPGLIHRLHRHLDQLADISIANAASERDGGVARLLAQGANLQTTSLPSELAEAQRHLRRVGWVVNELVDRLVAAKYMKGTE